MRSYFLRLHRCARLSSLRADSGVLVHCLGCDGRRVSASQGEACPQVRHSRAGGNPWTFLREVQRPWIPAFAGMTAESEPHRWSVRVCPIQHASRYAATTPAAPHQRRRSPPAPARSAPLALAALHRVRATGWRPVRAAMAVALKRAEIRVPANAVAHPPAHRTNATSPPRRRAPRPPTASHPARRTTLV